MKPFVLLLLLTCSLIACAQHNIPPQEKELVITNVNVIPMDREVVLQNKTVVIRNGVIASVEDAGKAKWNKITKVINGKGKYLMPGLAEMHAHVPPNDDMEAMKEVLLLFAANGITTIRGMLGHPKHLELRELIKKGKVLGPKLYTSGPSANGNSTPNAAAAIQLVKDQKAAGYDFIKIHPGISLDAFSALAQAAKEVNLPFAGHVPSDVGIWNAVELGLLTIDHLDGFVEALIPGKERFTEGSHGLFALHIFSEADTTRMQQLMQSLKKNDVWVVPTQALAVRWLAPVRSATERSEEPEMRYMDRKTITNWINAKQNTENNSAYKQEEMGKYISLRNSMIKACQDAGVPLLLGSDAPQVFNVPGFSTHHELEYLVDAGLSPYQALYSGTVAVGNFYGNKKMGTLQQGAPADLVLLSANPLQDIKAVSSIDGAVLNGRWLDRSWRTATLNNIADRKSK